MALLHIQPCAIFALLLSASTASLGITCDALKSDLDRKLASRPRLPAYTLHIVDASASEQGRVVGRCDLGARKIVYVTAPRSAKVGKAGAKAAVVTTECKPGYRGPDCAVRVGAAASP
jgi:Protein of unknown function (DUF1161)